MLNASQLDRAVSQGIISREQVEALQKLALGDQTQGGEAVLSSDIDFTVATQDEPFRLLKGFRDFFIAIGIVILSIGLSMLVGGGPFRFIVGDSPSGFGLIATDWTTTGGLLVLVVIAIAISEWVTKSQRLPLSSLVLTLVFALWSGQFASAAFYSLAISVGVDEVNLGVVNALVPYAGVIGAIVALIWHYKRYRLPFVLLPLASAAVLGILMLSGGVFNADENSMLFRIVLGLSGIGVFVIAMMFDMKDRYRTTRLSECAFWLHLLAAPMIVHSLLMNSIDGGLSAITMLLVVLVFAIFALIIDRRAMLVSALVYLGYSIFSIIGDISFFGEFNNSASLVVLGAMVLGLGLGWAPIRRFFVTNLLSASLRDKLPPVAAA